MKYLLMPIWRLLIALNVLWYQIVTCIGWFLLLIWELKFPKLTAEEHFWFPLHDRYEHIRDFSKNKDLELDFPPEEYYRNPWDALIGKKSYKPE